MGLASLVLMLSDIIGLQKKGGFTMLNNAKAAIKTAAEQNQISPVSVSSEDQERFFSHCRRSSVTMFLFSLALLAAAALVAYLLIAVAHVIVYGISVLIGIIIVVCFPVISLWNIFSTRSAINKGDYDFHVGQVIGRTEKGYKIRGLEQGDLTFDVDGKNAPDLVEGNNVVIARLKEEVSLLVYKG